MFVYGMATTKNLADHLSSAVSCSGAVEDFYPLQRSLQLPNVSSNSGTCHRLSWGSREWSLTAEEKEMNLLCSFSMDVISIITQENWAVNLMSDSRLVSSRGLPREGWLRCDEVFWVTTVVLLLTVQPCSYTSCYLSWHFLPLVP